jgi:hypothetical protein
MVDSAQADAASATSDLIILKIAGMRLAFVGSCGREIPSASHYVQHPFYQERDTSELRRYPHRVLEDFVQRLTFG